nr:SDR family NAD(P)-dependent oxidoreductase [Parvularcula dongshanensis]
MILVTGASRGIGRAAALEMARRGHHVLCLARTVGALEALDDEVAKLGGQCSLIPADLTDEAAMERLPGALAERFGKLDALILNAGTLGELTPVTDVDGKLLSSAMTLNVTANWLLLGGLDPLLRASEAGRVVGVTSGRARKAVPFWGLYAASKAAFERLILTYAAERENGAVKANLVDPGPIATRMRQKAMPGEDQSTLPQPEDLAPLVADMAEPSWEESGTLVSFKAWREDRPTS